MDLSAGRRRIQRSIVSEKLSELYPHDLSFYSVPPRSEIALHEFEDISLERLQLLRILEQAGFKGHIPFSDDWKTCVKEDLNKANLKKFTRLLSGSRGQNDLDYQARRNDHISHFILRIAYCRSDELRRWYLNRELEWFKLRFLYQTQDGIKEFLQLNKLTYIPISQEEKEELRDDLLRSTTGLSSYIFETTEFYKVYFTEVCSLVRTRKVYLRGGFAYIPASELVVCIHSQFRTFLSKELDRYCSSLPLLDDSRVTMLLNNLHNVHTGSNYYKARTVGQNSLDPRELDSYSKKHYPLCMRHIHETLRATHHLKHQSRLQYGLFLKAIGLLYDDALVFWRDEFTKVMDAGKFDKEHVYNIKHTYGKVGRMTSYAPYSCIKIILNNVGPGEHHGCPFKHWDPNIIKQQAVEKGISGEGANAIKELAASGHYQIACGKYFELTHNKAASTGISHPNQYVEESVNLEKEKAEVKK